METLEQQTFLSLEEESRCSQPAYLANPLPWPGSERAKAMTVGSGRQCSTLLDQSNPLGAFSKILMESSVWGNSLECCHIWNRLDTRFGLSAFQLVRWEQVTSDIECSLLPTP